MDGLKKKAQANGTPAKGAANNTPKGKKDSPAGPKKAKIAKLDGETVKGGKAKKPVGKAAETKPSKAEKKEGKKFGKKGKAGFKAKKRMGKNKFNKLKSMLKKQEKK